MKVLAALALALASASVAARSAAEREHGGASVDAVKINIDKIVYEAEESTKICLTGEEKFPNGEVIELFMKKYATSNAEEDVVTPYKCDPLDNPQTCVTFKAPVPASNEVVEYVVVYIPTENAEETKDVVKFTFENLKDPPTDTFQCDGVWFTRQDFDASGDADCINADAADAGVCYQVDLSNVEPGCTKPSNDDFTYCQRNVVKELGSAADEHNAAAAISTLSYVTKAVELTTALPPDSYAVIIHSDTENTNFPQVVKLDDTKAKFSSDPTDSLVPSTNTYTTCVVVEGGAAALEPDNRADEADTVTTASTITDLEVQGKCAPEGDDQPQANFYEFGLMRPSREQTKFHARSGASSAVTINCEELNKQDRCYGYLKRENQDSLKISYANNNENIDGTNIITVDEASLESFTA